MRFYTNQHPLYYGVDLHARSMYVCMVSHDGEILLHRTMTAAREPLPKAIAPARDGLLIAVAGLCTCYGLADLGAAGGHPVVWSPVLSRTARQSGKALDDTLEAHQMAALRRGGLHPHAAVSPVYRRVTTAPPSGCGAATCGWRPATALTSDHEPNGRRR
jgi:hypothetical protein